MELDISILANVGMWPVSGSQVTHGKNAASETWNAALESPMVLDTPEKLAAARKHVAEWNREWEGLPEGELNAVLVQMIAADIRDYTNKVDLSELTRTDLKQEGMERFFKVGKKYYYTLGL